MTSELIKNLKSLYWRLSSKNTRKFILQRITDKITIISAFIWRRMLINTTFIAITGSVGKTTTKEFLSDILEQRFSVIRTPGNSNLRRFKGLEQTILSTRPWHKFAVIEIGTEKPGDMKSAAKFLKPDVAIVLDIKHCHTNVFKSLESIAEEKSYLLKELNVNGCAVLNQDNLYVAAMTFSPKSKIIRFGKNNQAEFRLLTAESKWPERLKLSVLINNSTYEIETQLIGAHWTTAIMAALATANYCGIPIPDAIETIRSIEPFWARMQPITLPNKATIVRDDWNGSIDTFEVALQFLDQAQAIRKIVVFSDFSDSSKKLRTRANYLGRIAASHANLALFVGDYADRSEQSAIAAGLDRNFVHGFFNLSDATDFLKKELQAGDLVLIKGQSNHHMSRIYLGLLGNVTCTLSSCSKQILCDRCQDLGFKWNPDLKGLMAPPGSGV